MRRPDQGQRFKRSMYASGCPVYCCYCMQPVPKEEATVEHVVPKSVGGRDRHSNLLIACQPCNMAVGKDHAKLQADTPAFQKRRRRVKRPSKRQQRKKQAAQEIANRLQQLFREMELEKQS